MKPKVMQDIERKLEGLAKEVRGMREQFDAWEPAELTELDETDSGETQLETLTKEVAALREAVEGNQTAAAPKVTKKDLMEIDGVGPATADKILKLLK